jgi:hypothetical protein
VLKFLTLMLPTRSKIQNYCSAFLVISSSVCLLYIFCLRKWYIQWDHSSEIVFMALWYHVCLSSLGMFSFCLLTVFLIFTHQIYALSCLYIRNSAVVGQKEIMNLSIILFFVYWHNNEVNLSGYVLTHLIPVLLGVCLPKCSAQGF